MFIALTSLLVVVSSAFAACPEKPSMAGAYPCSSGSSWDSSGKTTEWAQYCCMNGKNPTGDTKITCSGSGWSSPAGNCGSTPCGAELKPTAPFYTPKRGPQCSSVKAPKTRCLGDVAASLIGGSITEILERHNCWRSKVDPPPKKPLPKLIWDDELATLAERWAAQCPQGHDDYADRELPSRKTGDVDWKYVGQNICYSSYNQSWSACIDGWALEKDDFEFGKGSKNGKATGHYTQVVAERSYSVGCGMSNCKTGKWAFVQICNYGPAGNFNGGEKTPYVRA